MSEFIAALPMYDWPEVRAGVDAQWADLRTRFLAAGIDAPECLVRRNADMPAVPNGIRDAAGLVIAADPATLPPDDLDYPTLWRHPKLLFGQTCWGPMETTGLADHVYVVGQPDYSDVEGGAGELYSSAVVMRADEASAPDGDALPPLPLLRGARLAYNEPHSMSGLLALKRDLEAMGESLAIFSGRIETGGHRNSIRAVAEGGADVATIDCRSWSLATSHEPAATKLRVVGWTSRRKGLPYIRSAALSTEIVQYYPSLM
jgi:ABC-type phosphate/phosphonate transport system substrate-binding protein